MEIESQRLYQAKEFANKAGITVRTLHFYDHEGLLKPRAHTDSGYRLYGEAELERLEQILALRFVGFTIAHIKKLFAGTPQPVDVALRMQREIIEQQKRGLETALRAIADAEHLLAADSPNDRWEALRRVIEAFKMANDWSWAQNYYTDEDRAKLAQRMKETPKEVIERGERDWAELIAEVEAAAANEEDPHGEHAQSLKC